MSAFSEHDEAMTFLASLREAARRERITNEEYQRGLQLCSEQQRTAFDALTNHPFSEEMIERMTRKIGPPHTMQTKESK